MTEGGQEGGKYGRGLEGRIPPNQAVSRKFPLMTVIGTPEIDISEWSFSIRFGPRTLFKWDWERFNALPQADWQRDVHCVTRWSKFDTKWRGVVIDDLLADAGIDPPSEYTLFHGFEGYSTNLLLSDLIGGKAMIATRYDGAPLPVEHGGPARLLVPHLYFWKSAKWVKSMQFTSQEESGFWELRGYHQRGDPWAEERFS